MISRAGLRAGCIAAACGLAAAAFGGPVTPEEYRAAKGRIEAEAKEMNAACERLPGQARDVCRAEARGKSRIARAELEYIAELCQEFDAVAIIRNTQGVEINLILNAKEDEPNILMDVPVKHPGYTHVALHVSSIKDTIDVLKASDIKITQGPVSFGEDGGVSVFVRDPDRNVIELRGAKEDVPGITQYTP